MKTFIDLFCGIGGFHLALASKGLRCVFASDIDPKAREVYAANFGLEPAGDITKIPVEDIPPHDVLCGGFPCQPFSLANTKAKGMEEARGTLFFEIARIAAHHKPKMLLLENVPRITSFDKGRVLETILRTLDGLGYRVAVHKLNAADYGCATARKRIYFVCIRKDLQLVSGVPQPSEFRDCVANHLRPDLDTKHLERPIEDYVFGKHGNPLSNAQGSKLLGRKKGATRAAKIQGARVYDPNAAYPAITCSSKEAVLVPANKPRQLHIEEAKTIQGFPPDHILSKGNEGYKQLGNSVIPRMVEVIYDAVQPDPAGQVSLL